MIKFIQCPIVGTGAGWQDAYRPKVFDIRVANPTRPFNVLRCCIKSKPEGDAQYGHPVKTWAICVIRGADLSDVDTDPECIDLLDGVDIDDNLLALKTRLKAKTLASLTAAKRTKLRALAAACDVDGNQFVGTDSVWDVLKACFAVQDGALDDQRLEAAG